MTKKEAGTSSASPAATPFELHLHFEGAFIFSVKTEGDSSDSGAALTGVDVYAPVCGHTNAATVNTGSTYMLESYWHCIEPTYDPSYTPSPITLGQLKTNIGGNTPWTPANRPIGSGWDIAFRLALAPEDWQSDQIVAGAAACFSGMDAGIIPGSVALEQILIYKQVSSAKFHGACFAPDFTPVNGVVNLLLTSEVPFIPTKQHERRAAEAMAGLLGLDLLLETPLGPAAAPAGAFRPNDHAGGCMMGVVTGP